jgi:hypothetical protein
MLVLTIITANECISVSVGYDPVDMFLSLLHRDVHIPIQAL